LSGDRFGQITLTIPARITNSYTFDSAVYDLDVQEPNETYTGSGLKRYRLLQGGIGLIKRNISTTISDVLSPINENNIVDACLLNCSSYESIIYNGNPLIIRDNKTTSNTVFVSDNRAINYVELAINGLSHPNPQDLSIFLAPPSGQKILLSAFNKITNYQNGFSFVLSDRAPPDTSLSTIKNGEICRITDKTNSVRFDTTKNLIMCSSSGCVDTGSPINPSSPNNETLLGSFGHLTNYVPSSGNWTLYIQDNDVRSSGSIEAWKLVITYQDIEI
jgi:subtilisin-like proprotein convertase family protein